MTPTLADFHAVQVSDFQGFIDNGLRRFRNVEFVQKQIIDRHKVPEDQQDNAKKQVHQVAQCLNLAQEYLKSARSASLSIKPVLIYYSLLNLALTEVLIKQDGRSSLDRAREKNAHHGLEIAFPKNVGKIKNLKELLEALIAKPHQKSSGRAGTFNLWHSSAREHPVIGRIFRGDNSISYEAVLKGDSKPLPTVPDQGLSFLEVLKLLPSFSNNLRHLDILSHYGRGNIQVDQRPADGQYLMFTVHPVEDPVWKGISDRIFLSGAAIEDLEFKSVSSGLSLRWRIADSPIRTIMFPMITSLTIDDLRICSVKSPITEFGAFYLAFFILGNLCRYYPDVWMPHLDSHSDLAILAEGLCEEFFLRIPGLVLGELGGTLFVRKQV